MKASRLRHFGSTEDDYEIEELMAELEDADDEDDIEASFCPTGEGGGVDPSCSPGRSNATDQSALKAHLAKLSTQLKSLYARQEELKAKAAKERASSPKGVASSATKKERSAVNKKIDEVKADVVSLHKQLEGSLEIPVPKLGPAAQPAPEAPKLTPPVAGEAAFQKAFEGKHTDPPVFASKYAAENWLQKEYNLTLQVEGKITDDRATALAQVTGQHLSHMSNNFELLDKYRTQPTMMGQPGGYGGFTEPYRGSGNYRITTAFSKSSTGGDYNPNTGTIRMKDSLKIYGTTFAPKFGDHNVDFSYAGCFRHEYGHRVWGLALDNKDRAEFGHLWKEYRQGKGNYKDKSPEMYGGSLTKPEHTIGAKAVGVYAMTNIREFWAESFCAVTSPAYGSNGKRLPEDLEKFMHKTLGKREISLDFGVTLSFCPTGPGGGVDPTCSPGRAATTDTVSEGQMNVWKAALKIQTEKRDHAVAMIKQIKATGSTKGLSQWKKARKDANQIIDNLKKQISTGQWAKKDYPAPTPTALSAFKIPGLPNPIYAKTIEEVQKLYNNAKPWNPAYGAPTPGISLPGSKEYTPPGYSAPKAPVPPPSDNPPWVHDDGSPVPGSGVRELTHAEGGKEYKAWRESLSSDEAKGIHSYTGGGYHSLNEGFRKGVFTSAQLDRVHGIDSALARTSLKEDTLLHRKVGSSPETDKIYQNLKAGDVYVERGYGSTAIERGKWSGQYLLNIKAPVGTKGAYVAQISSSGAHEREFLLQRDTMFKVVRVRKEGTYNRIIDMELIVGKK